MAPDKQEGLQTALLENAVLKQRIQAMELKLQSMEQQNAEMKQNMQSMEQQAISESKLLFELVKSIETVNRALNNEIEFIKLNTLSQETFHMNETRILKRTIVKQHKSSILSDQINDRLQKEIAVNKQTMQEIAECVSCPITHQPFANPSILSDGHTYEGDAINNWLLHNNTSPITREKLIFEQQYTNYVAKHVASVITR